MKISPVPPVVPLGGRVCVLGSANVDYSAQAPHLPAPGETVTCSSLSVSPGGKSSNQAACAALLGCNARLFACVGHDVPAEVVMAGLRRAGVDTSALIRSEQPTGVALITVDNRGENTIAYCPGANAELTPELVSAQAGALAGAAVLGLCLETPLPTVRAAIKLAHAHDIPVALNCSPVPTADEPLPLELVDTLVVNEHEAAALLDTSEKDMAADWARVGQALGERGARRIIVTLGSSGLVALEGAEVMEVAAPEVDVRDTTGCGDASFGAILAGMSSGLSLGDTAQLASLVGSYAAEGRGAQASYGTLEQVRARFS